MTIAYLRWTETLDVDREPVALAGTLEIVIKDGDRLEAARLETPVSGAPQALDVQLDAALRAFGWERTSEVAAWPATPSQDGTGNVGGRCAVRRTRLAVEFLEEGNAVTPSAVADVFRRMANHWPVGPVMEPLAGPLPTRSKRQVAPWARIVILGAYLVFGILELLALVGGGGSLLNVIGGLALAVAVVTLVAYSVRKGLL